SKDGSSAPSSFTYHQAHSIGSADVPAIAPTTAYAIQSDGGSVKLPALNLTGTAGLTVNSGTTIDEDTAVTVGGLAKFTAGTDITLNGANNFGSLSLNSTGAGANVQVTEASDTALDNVSVTGLAGKLTINSGGAISEADNKTITVGGLATFNS